MDNEITINKVELTKDNNVRLQYTENGKTNDVEISAETLINAPHERCPICGGRLIWNCDYDSETDENTVFSTWTCQKCERTIEVYDKL